MNILLIAGHGAGDPGAIGNGYKEADLVRELLSKIKSILDPFSNVTVFDTTKNMYRHLKSGKTFDFSPFDYILELHFNAGISEISKNNGITTGTEILVHTNESGVTVEDKIVKNIAGLWFKNRGVKRRNNLQNMNIIHRKGKSYALLETCFIDDADDMKLYSSKKEAVALAIANGIIDGFGLKKSITELTTVNDIVWELANRGIISDKNLWLQKLEKDTDSYWLARKCVNYIISKWFNFSKINGL